MGCAVFWFYKEKRMKKIVCLIVMVLINIVAFSVIQGPAFELEEFDVDIMQYEHMIQIKNLNTEDFDTTYAFTDKNKTYQVRYGFFKQIQNDLSLQQIKMPYMMCVMPVTFNIAGFEEGLSSTNYNDADVKKEFNGDFGTTVYIQNPKSQYGKGFKHIMLNFFCKEKQGIVVQTILFNSLDFLEKTEFMEIFHSFKFHE
jgi:hypothetical protein